jgi:hypothetical protein
MERFNMSWRAVRRFGAAQLGLALGWVMLPAAAQPAHDFATWRPIAGATRITPKEAPAIDGDVHDGVWAKAKPIDEFYQLEPHEGAPADERTVVRVLYDEDNLYFAIEADDPAAVTARIKQRDADIAVDDLFRIYLDPGQTRRNGYIFEVNPLGARREGLIQNNTDVIYQWNTLWSAKAKVTDKGWTAEVVIPFRSISYGDSSEWGFDLFRMVRKKSERIRWSSINKTIASQDISHSGMLTGIGGIAKGIGLDVQAFALARYRENWAGGQGSGISLRPSGNLFYKVTPSLTGTLTYNTDFSDAPLDTRRVNIGRFSLFYPERRDFFLQDASAFEFGGAPLTVNNDPNAAPFFSRRIGIVNGTPVNILGGAKLSGDYEGIGIGALSVMTAGGAGAGEQLLSVARVTAPVFEESKVGFIFTNGDPTGTARNTVGGVDFQYRKSDFLGDKQLRSDFYYEHSSSGRSGEDDSFGFQFDLPNEPWGYYFRFKQVGNNFDPALGFVARPGIREYQTRLAYKERLSGGPLRWFEVGLWADTVTDLHDTVQSGVPLNPWVSLFFESGDSMWAEMWEEHEIVPSFDLPDGIVVPAGEYVFDTWHAHFESASSRLISTVADVQYGKYFDGKLLQTDVSLNLNPNETLSTGIRYVMQDMRMPGGSVTIQIAALDASVNFTPDMYVRAQVQYDNISKAVEVSARYRWEFAPGTELLVVVGDDATLNHGRYSSHQSQLSVRLGKTFRL